MKILPLILDWTKVRDIIRLADSLIGDGYRYMSEQDYYEHVLDVLAEEEQPKPDPGIKRSERYLFLIGKAEEVLGMQMHVSSRSFKNIQARRFVAFKLRQEGWTLQQIALEMGKTHPTVINYIRRMKECMEMPVFYAEDIKTYMKFAEAADEK